MPLTTNPYEAFLTSSKDLKYGLQADRTILWALQVCPSQASVTSVKLFSSRRCRNDVTMLLWKSFHLRKNCCWCCSPAIFGFFTAQSATEPIVFTSREHITTFFLNDAIAKNKAECKVKHERYCAVLTLD